ncbi:hypothetical protein CKO11_09475 [Rhodobacter sp. TJ_12]|uniref:DUF2291 family protein n=1 Tax=Rhodobacter sp. TJ_12 TaxID=2029399 RepID=UPI001CBAD6FF|nr:DUF2291 family protein [Rhodobacter sp. TJ_12]MBZ4022688.1 hypothetical protein [Rhodobacter sp. TJ_12]
MKFVTVTALCLASAMALSGCKIVPDTAEDDATPAADASGDAARIETLLAASYDAKLLPHITAKAQSVTSLRGQLAADFAAAAAEHGASGAGAGAPVNFALADTGTVVATKLDSRARTLDLDVDADGTADVVLQLGPVVRGSALRDVAPQLYDFTSFRDQIEFAKLGRALNDRASGGLVIPEGDLMGATVGFTGVVPLKSAKDKWLVTPVAIEVTP